MLEEKESKNLIKAYWRFGKKSEKKDQGAGSSEDGDDALKS